MEDASSSSPSHSDSDSDSLVEAQTADAHAHAHARASASSESLLPEIVMDSVAASVPRLPSSGRKGLTDRGHLGDSAKRTAGTDDGDVGDACSEAGEDEDKDDARHEANGTSPLGHATAGNEEAIGSMVLEQEGFDGNENGIAGAAAADRLS